MEDAIGLAKGNLKHLQKSIEKGDWIAEAVLGALGVMNIAIKPPVLFAFMLFCGAPVAKIAPAQ